MENNLTVTPKSGYGFLPEKVIYKRWKPQGKFDWTFWCFGSVVSYGRWFINRSEVVAHRGLTLFPAQQSSFLFFFLSSF